MYIRGKMIAHETVRRRAKKQKQKTRNKLDKENGQQIHKIKTWPNEIKQIKINEIVRLKWVANKRSPHRNSMRFFEPNGNRFTDENKNPK